MCKQSLSYLLQDLQELLFLKLQKNIPYKYIIKNLQNVN